jgi:dolichol-phosphate mannosyltransferase
MARVSLIVPQTSRIPHSPGQVERSRRCLAALGHEVETLIVSDATCPEADLVDAIRIDESGLARGAVEGLRRSGGDVMIVMDPSFGDTPDRLAELVGLLSEGEADLVIASRFTGDGTGPLRRLLGKSMRLVAGTSDPMSGLVGIKRDLLDEISGELSPSGDHLLWELLVNVEPWRREEFRVDASRLVSGRLGFHELRHLKKIADQRYGNLSRLLQFCIVGASGMLVDVSTYALFHKLLSKTDLVHRTVPIVGGTGDLALAAALSISLALSWNFMLNRRLTFSYARGGSVVRQYLTYALSNSPGIALSWTLRLFLPSRVAFFDQHKLAAAVVGIVAATGISFSMARWLVFQKTPGEQVETPNFADSRPMP